MIDMKKETKGITLIEVMIVSAIVVVLLGVLWLAIGPSIKRKALEARVTSDLHQIALAYNMYVSEWDGKYPRSMRSLPASLPQGLPGDNYYDALAPHSQGPRQYFLWHTQQDEDDMDRLGCNFRWNPQENGVVAGEFIERNTGRKMWAKDFWPDGSFHWVLQDAYTVPYARIDGSIGWVHPPEDYMAELATRRAFQR